jgi:protein TonB
VNPSWIVIVSVVAGCSSAPGATVTLSSDAPANSSRREEPPIPLDPDPPIIYPEPLVAQRLGGTVVLRLYVDSAGKVVADSTTVQESSGYPALDSAAVAGIGKLRYAPAIRNGAAAGTLFLQPVDFRPPPGGGTIP